MEMKTFREAYGVLQRHAETLRDQSEPDIDNLLAIVTDSVAAYKVCKDRIDAVEKALQAALTDVVNDSGRMSGSQLSNDDGDSIPNPVQLRNKAENSAKRGNSGFDDMDDDIPF